MSNIRCSNSVCCLLLRLRYGTAEALARMTDRDENMHGLVVDLLTAMLGATRWSRSLPMLPKTCCVCANLV